MSDKPRFQFSIAWLLGITTVIALGIALPWQLRGVVATMAAIVIVPSILLYVVLKVGTIANEKQKMLPFWQASSAYLIMILVMYSSGAPDEADLIMLAIVLGTGLMLSTVPLYRANNVTRLYVLPAFLIYLLIHILIGYRAIGD